MSTYGNYSTGDWKALSGSWGIRTYLAYPDSGVPVDMPSATLLSRGVPAMTWDEATQQAMEKWADAWERLADL